MSRRIAYHSLPQSSPKTIDKPDDLLRIWCHECLRVFSDRLVEKKDTDWFFDLLVNQVRSGFKRGWEQVTGSDDRRLIFGDFMREDEAYAVLPAMDVLITRMTANLEDFNATSKRSMELVLFPFAVEHVCRILRVIKQPFGNALLVGVGGSGRQSLTTLACHMAEFEIFRIELSKNYDMSAWRDDVKRLLQQAGEAGTQTVFLFTDTQIKDEAMVEDINNILNMGEVPNLYAADEVQTILEGVTSRAKDLGWSDMTPAGLWRLFVQQCRANLHVVLCMSPIGEAFRTRLRKFPSLVNCCTIDWFTAWPRDALHTVCTSFLADISMEDDERAAVLDMCCFFQESVSSLSTAYQVRDHLPRNHIPRNHIPRNHIPRNHLPRTRSSSSGTTT